jgi:hypothetical protein
MSDPARPYALTPGPEQRAERTAEYRKYLPQSTFVYPVSKHDRHAWHAHPVNVQQLASRPAVVKSGSAASVSRTVEDWLAETTPTERQNLASRLQARREVQRASQAS